MKIRSETIRLLILLLLAAPLQAKTFFLGRITEVEPQLDLIVVKGGPSENVKAGQLYDIVLGQEVYGRAKVTYVADDGFDARVIEGSSRELSQLVKGSGEQAAYGYEGLIVLEAETPLDAVLIFKGGDVKKVRITDQLKEGFKISDDKGNVLAVVAEDLRDILYPEEPEYRKYVKEEALVTDVVPGEREREQARIQAAKLARDFKEAIRLATGFISSSQFDKALAKADEAINLKPEEFQGYLVKGRALMGVKNFPLALASLQTALDKKPDKKYIPDIEYYMALTYRDMGNLKESNVWLEKAVDHGKDDLDTSYLLSSIQLESGKFNESLNTILWALKTGRKGDKKVKTEMQVRAAAIYFEKQNNLEQSEKFVNDALKASPDHKEAIAIRNKILLERSKLAQRETIDVEAIGGAWRSSDNQMYISFFEETIVLLVYRNDPMTKANALIIIGGDQQVSQEEEVISIKDPKTQKFVGVSGKALKYSQIKEVSERFFSGDEEVMDVDQEIVFKILDFTPLKLKLLLDGKKYDMVPMDQQE